MAQSIGSKIVSFASPVVGDAWASLGLLVLRVGLGAQMAALHGYGKLAKFEELSGVFPDPLGVGRTASLALATGAEFFMSILVVLGLFTRLTALPLVVTMAVAAFIIHADDPWSDKEMALLYLAGFLALFLAGAGRFSLDSVIRRKFA